MSEDTSEYITNDRQKDRLMVENAELRVKVLSLEREVMRLKLELARALRHSWDLDHEIEEERERARPVETP